MAGLTVECLTILRSTQHVIAYKPKCVQLKFLERAKATTKKYTNRNVYHKMSTSEMYTYPNDIT